MIRGCDNQNFFDGLIGVFSGDLRMFVMNLIRKQKFNCSLTKKVASLPAIQLQKCDFQQR